MWEEASRPVLARSRFVSEPVRALRRPARVVGWDGLGSCDVVEQLSTRPRLRQVGEGTVKCWNAGPVPDVLCPAGHLARGRGREVEADRRSGVQVRDRGAVVGEEQP